VSPLWRHETGPADGPVVVLLHGTMDRSAGLLRLSRRLDEVNRVVRYDRRGYGRSSPHDGPFAMADQVGDLLDLIGGRRAVLFGHSYGGDVALAAAAHHPDVVAGVVVYEPPLSWLDWWPSSTAGSRALAGDGDAADAAERFMRSLIGDERWQRLPPGTRAARRREGRAMVGELADLRRQAPWRGPDVGVPVVAMVGERGAAHHRAGVGHLVGVIPASTSIVVAGAKHFGPNTHPDDVAPVVQAMVDSVSRRRGAPGS